MRLAESSRLSQLDSFRGICCLLVLVAHLHNVEGLSWISPRVGPLGVGCFFVLSGFLITRSLLNSGVSLRQFYNKRAARILPPYFLTLLVLALVWPGRELVWCATFTFNFLLVTGAQDYFHVTQTADAIPPVGHFWSLCVEEHYYWIWPIVVVYASGLWRAMTLFCFVAISPLAAWWIITSLDSCGFGRAEAEGLIARITLTQLPGLAFGSSIALCEAWWTRRLSWGQWSVSRLMLAGLGVLATFPLLKFGIRDIYWGPVCLHVLCTAAFAVCHDLPVIGRVHWLRYLGRISYGAYLYHLPIYAALGLVFSERHAPIHSGIVAFLGTIAIAVVSFHWFEQPLMRWMNDPVRDRSRLGITLAGLLLVAAVMSLLMHSERHPLHAVVGMAPKISPELKRIDLRPTGTAVGAYRWMGVEHQFDANGFRRNTPFPPKQVDVLRIVTVGDSLTWGSCVAQDMTFSAVIERELQTAGVNAEVLNCGTAGGQAEDIVNVVRQHVLQLNPDWVIYAASATDYLPGGFHNAAFSHAGWDDEKNCSRFRNSLQELQEIADEAGFKFGVVAFASDVQAPESKRTADITHRVVDEAHVTWIPTLDFWGRDQNFSVPLDGHPNSEAHRLIGEELAKYLLDNLAVHVD